MYKKPEPTVKSYSSKKSRKTNKPDKQKTDAKSIATVKSTKTTTKRGRQRKLDDTKSVKSLKTLKSTRSTRKQAKSRKAMSVKSMPTEKPKRAYKRRRPPTPGPPKTRKYQRKSVSKDLHSTSLPTMAEMHLLQQPIPTSSTPFKTNGIVDRRPSNGLPSAIKMRINYNKVNCSKETSPSFRASAFASNYKFNSAPMNGISRLNTSSGCLNCSKYTGLSDSILTNLSSTHRSMLPMMVANGGGSCNREEFYKYLGITNIRDTNPMQEKTTSPQQTSPLDTSAYNHRRSLRVFIQQRQNEFSRLSKSPDKSATLLSPTRTKYNNTNNNTSANNVSASPSDSMKR